MTTLALRGITKAFGDQPVLEEVSLDVQDGEFLVLVGPSGCGKSTLLRIIAGLVPATSGDVEMDGRRVNDLDPRARDVAMVFQNYALYPHMSVRKNLAFPLKLAKVARPEIDERVTRTASVLGIDSLLERKPGTLSGGQMQRVALGRAIIRNPKVFLFDEPLSNLDAQLRTEMRAEIARLHQSLGITTVYVTHDQAEAMTMGSRVCVLNEGRVQQIGKPLEVFDEPANRFVASFMGNPPMNLLRGKVEGGEFRAGPLRAPSPPAAEGEAIVLGIRPHHVELGEGTLIEVAQVETLGTRTHLHLTAADERLLVSREGHVAVAPGERISVRLPASRIHWFSGRDGARLAPRGA